MKCIHIKSCGFTDPENSCGVQPSVCVCVCVDPAAVSLYPTQLTVLFLTHIQSVYSTTVIPNTVMTIISTKSQSTEQKY